MEYPYTTEDREIIRYNRQRTFVGSAEAVCERLVELARQAGVKEIVVTTMTHDHADRRRSYELLAQAFGLQGQT